MERRDESAIGPGTAGAARFVRIVDRHCQQQAEPMRLPCPLCVALAEVDTVSTPAARCGGLSGEQHGQSPHARDAHQAP